MPLIVQSGRSKARPAGRRASGDSAPVAGQIAWAVVLLVLIAIAFAKLAR